MGFDWNFLDTRAPFQRASTRGRLILRWNVDGEMRASSRHAKYEVSKALMEKIFVCASLNHLPHGSRVVFSLDLQKYVITVGAFIIPVKRTIVPSAI